MCEPAAALLILWAKAGGRANSRWGCAKTAPVLGLAAAVILIRGLDTQDRSTVPDKDWV